MNNCAVLSDSVFYACSVEVFPDKVRDQNWLASECCESTSQDSCRRSEFFDAGHFVKSNGGPCPERHKIRAPSFNNIPTFKATCIGQPIADVTITMAAIDPCYSCTERMLVVKDASTGKELMDFNGLVRLSQEKTEQIRKEL